MFFSYSLRFPVVFFAKTTFTLCIIYENFIKLLKALQQSSVDSGKSGVVTVKCICCVIRFNYNPIIESENVGVQGKAKEGGERKRVFGATY